MTRPARRLVVVVLSLAVAVATLLGIAPARADTPPPTYRNAVSDAFSDTFADPAVILAKDGWWYAYSTADPLYAGDPSGTMHIARTRDWVRWEYLGTVFDQTNRPAYATAGAGLWAPDIRYIAGRYVMYFTVTDTTLNPGGDPGIGVATADRPEGPWTPAAEPIVAPRPRPETGGFFGTIDPAGFTDLTGQNYLYFGGYGGGFFGAKISRDGLRVESDYTQLTPDGRYEGGYVVQHDGWYYFMASSANCCAGPTTGYSVFSGRSRSPLGPFVDADGIGLNDPVVGGTVMITQNGNRWIGAGHHAVATDTEGRDFIVYHALDRGRPWLNAPFGINRRPMLIDPIDWIDGWPTTRAGAGPSDRALPAPVTGSGLGITAHDPAAGGVRALRPGPTDPQAGATATVRGTATTVQPAPAGRVRVRLDVLGTRPITVGLGSGREQVTVTLDPGRERLTARVTAAGRTRTSTAVVPEPGERWSTLVVEITGDRVLAQVSESDLGDHRAQLDLTGTGLSLPAAPVRLEGAGTVIDNLSVRGVAREATETVPVPQAGAVLTSYDFETGTDGLTWVRRNPAATVTGGELSWPLESSDLVGSANTAGVLLSEAPAGAREWIAETRLTLPLGTDSIRNFQQAGLIAYRTDDDFARLSKVAIGPTRQVEYGRELVATLDGRTSYGGAIQGTPGEVTWLRLAYRENSAAEHQFRAAVSRDGRTWTWGSVWTFAPGPRPKVGLIAHGGAAPAVNARFDYLRYHATSWPVVV